MGCLGGAGRQVAADLNVSGLLAALQAGGKTGGSSNTRAKQWQNKFCSETRMGSTACRLLSPQASGILDCLP
jgi:hypothetical protein